VKWFSIALLGAGLIAAAAFGIIRSNNNKEMSLAALKKAEAEEKTAEAAERKAEKDRQTAASRAAAEASAAKKAEESHLAAEAQRDAEKAAAKKAESDRARAVEEKEKAVADKARAEAEYEKASAERSAALAAKETAKLEAAKAKSQAEEKAHAAQIAADALEREKLVADKVIAEAKLRELKREQLLDFERELIAIKRDLDERVAALRPEKTIRDLYTIGVGDEDDDPLRNTEDAAAKLPENNPELPRGTRRLAKANRVVEEGMKTVGDENRTNVVSRMERLYIEAVREDRMVDADFYAKELKRMYPDWKYVPGKTGVK